MTTPDTRAITLADLPLLRKLSERGTILDSEVGLTRDARGSSAALISNILFPRGTYTFVSRANHQQVLGQFRYRPDDLYARIVYLASSIAEGHDDTLWLNILDAMTREAGRHGAHSLIAEVDAQSPLFETLRVARFATYTRQTIWAHDPVALSSGDVELPLTEETTDDQMAILALLSKVVPSMLMPVTIPTSEMQGWVYRVENRVMAYVAIAEGNQGVCIIPYIHPDVMNVAANILVSAIAHASRASKVPVYVCVRSYQCWLDDVLADLDFEAWAEQAIMVKHIAACNRQPQTSKVRLPTVLEMAQGATPFTWSVILHNDHEDQHKYIWNDG